MRQHASRIALCIGIGFTSALLLAATPQAQAASKATSTSSPPKKKSGAGKTKVPENNSGESQSERDKRLYRECQGLPNAGACAGYTRR